MVRLMVALVLACMPTSKEPRKGSLKQFKPYRA